MFYLGESYRSNIMGQIIINIMPKKTIIIPNINIKILISAHNNIYIVIYYIISCHILERVYIYILYLLYIFYR